MHVAPSMSSVRGLYVYLQYTREVPGDGIALWPATDDLSAVLGRKAIVFSVAIPILCEQGLWGFSSPCV